MFWVGLVIGIIIGLVSLSVISCLIVSGRCSDEEEKSKFDKLPPVKEVYNLIPIQKDNNGRKYTSREWARYYANKRNRTIHQSNSAINRARKVAKSTHDLPKLSQVNMVSKSKPTSMLLHTNELNKLEFRKQRQSNKNMRWADIGINGA